MLAAISLLTFLFGHSSTALLVLPFAVAIAGFALGGCNVKFRTQCLQTTMLIALLLAIGSSSAVIQLLRQPLTTAANTAPALPALLSQSSVCLLSFCYVILTALGLREKKAYSHR